MAATQECTQRKEGEGGGETRGEKAGLTNCLRPRSLLVRNFLVRMVQALSPIVNCRKLRRAGVLQGSCLTLVAVFSFFCRFTSISSSSSRFTSKKSHVQASLHTEDKTAENRVPRARRLSDLVWRRSWRKDLVFSCKHSHRNLCARRRFWHAAAVCAALGVLTTSLLSADSDAVDIFAMCPIGLAGTGQRSPS